MRKKRIFSAALAAALALTVVPAVQASASSELTNGSVSGDTSITGHVSAGEGIGNVTYVVSIPDKIDFGELVQPDTNSSDPVTRAGTVKAEIVESLPEGYRVAVFVKDAAASESSKDFRIIGQDSTNKGKELIYTITNEASQANLLTGTEYPNGYLVGAFQNTGDTVNLTLALDQNQLYGEYLSNWAGNYKGTLNFYSSVESVGSLN